MSFSLNIRHFDVSADSLLPGEACFLNACLATEAAASDKLTLNIPFWQRDYDWGKSRSRAFWRRSARLRLRNGRFSLGPWFSAGICPFRTSF